MESGVRDGRRGEERDSNGRWKKVCVVVGIM